MGNRIAILPEGVGFLKPDLIEWLILRIVTVFLRTGLGSSPSGKNVLLIYGANGRNIKGFVCQCIGHINHGSAVFGHVGCVCLTDVVYLQSPYSIEFDGRYFKLIVTGVFVGTGNGNLVQSDLRTVRGYVEVFFSCLGIGKADQLIAGIGKIRGIVIRIAGCNVNRLGGVPLGIGNVGIKIYRIVRITVEGTTVGVQLNLEVTDRLPYQIDTYSIDRDICICFRRPFLNIRVTAVNNDVREAMTVGCYTTRSGAGEIKRHIFRPIRRKGISGECVLFAGVDFGQGILVGLEVCGADGDSIRTGISLRSTQGQLAFLCGERTVVAVHNAATIGHQDDFKQILLLPDRIQRQSVVIDIVNKFFGSTVCLGDLKILLYISVRYCIDGVSALFCGKSGQPITVFCYFAAQIQRICRVGISVAERVFCQRDIDWIRVICHDLQMVIGIIYRPYRIEPQIGEGGAVRCGNSNLGILTVHLINMNGTDGTVRIEDEIRIIHGALTGVHRLIGISDQGVVIICGFVCRRCRHIMVSLTQLLQFITGAFGNRITGGWRIGAAIEIKGDAILLEPLPDGIQRCCGSVGA